MFHSARVKLTAWYLLIIMTISFAFSVFIFIGASREIDRLLRVERFRVEHPYLNFQLHQQFPPSKIQDIEVISDAKTRVIESLIGVNVIIFTLSAFLGYFLAGRTLQPIQKMVSEQHRFITDASHELRTPLTSLRSEIEVGLRDKKINLEQTKKLLESNLEEVLALQTLSDNLLELAQNDNGLPLQDMKDENIKEIIANAVKKVEPLAKKKNIATNSTVAKTIVKGVQDRLIEVFVILLDNAIKYSPNNSVISIESKKEDNHIIVSVIDNGVGVSSEDLPHIFDRFYRANKSRSKTNTPGYGLGLSIAKKIVQAHKGTILASSIPEEKTIFSVQLPCA